MEKIKKALNSYNTILKVIEEDNQILTNEILKHLKKELQQAMNYIPCCKSDSEQLVLFADWLQYNGKWSLPEQQAKDFLKEQQEQN